MGGYIIIGTCTHARVHIKALQLTAISEGAVKIEAIKVRLALEASTSRLLGAAFVGQLDVDVRFGVVVMMEERPNCVAHRAEGDVRREPAGTVEGGVELIR